MHSPNVLLTNFCSQSCSFCFARIEMKDKIQNREMGLDSFRRVLKKMDSSKTDTVKLLGGEPTLHSRFKEIVLMSLKKFEYVQVFTNGVFSEDIASFLQTHYPRVRLTYNVMTPGFLMNPKVREIIRKRISDSSDHTEVTFSLTIDPSTDINLVMKTISKDSIRKCKQFRIGLNNPIINEGNSYGYIDFPKIGKKLYELVRSLRESGSEAKISLNCGFTRCMFTKNEYDYLNKKEVIFQGWGCFGKKSSMDIATDLHAFHCFPLSKDKRVDISKKTLEKTEGELLIKRYEYWKKLKVEMCNDCPFYGFGPGKCPGPCIALRLNAIQNEKY